MIEEVGENVQIFAMWVQSEMKNNVIPLDADRPAKVKLEEQVTEGGKADAFFCCLHDETSSTIMRVVLSDEVCNAGEIRQTNG